LKPDIEENDLVIIHWTDASESLGETHREARRVTLMRSVGWVYRETDQSVFLASCLPIRHKWQITHILKCAIHKAYRVDLG